MLFSFFLDSDFIFGKNASCQLLRLNFKNKSHFKLFFLTIAMDLESMSEGSTMKKLVLNRVRVERPPHPIFHSVEAYGTRSEFPVAAGGVLRYISDGDERMRRNCQTQKKSFRLDLGSKKVQRPRT